MAKLSSTQIRTVLKEVPDWKKGGSTIRRQFEFEDFVAAMKFVNRVAKLAERANHHPDIDIRWNKVLLSLTTHDAGGLTDKDFELAKRLDRI
jgi:4a-hydroxytetrahydrobiopterin dehydratase